MQWLFHELWYTNCSKKYCRSIIQCTAAKVQFVSYAGHMFAFNWISSLKKTAKPQNTKAKGTIKKRCSGISLLKSFSRIRLKTWWLKWSNKSHLYHLSSRILIQLYKRRCLSVLYRGAKPKSPGFRMSMSVYAMNYSLLVGLFYFIHLFIAYPI